MSHLSSRIKQISQDTFLSLHVRNYRLYYIGQIISTSGTFMQSVAQAWLVLNLTNSGTALGLATALQYLPILFLGPYGGVIADRFSKRKILFFTQAISGILALILGVLVATGLVQVWMVYILAFCLGLVTVFDNPTRQTFYMELVGPDNLRNAVTLYSILVNLSRIIGPAIAGALIAAVGLAPCFIINGVSYVAVIIMLAMMHADELIITPPVPPARGQLGEGFKYVFSTPILGSILLMMAIIGTLTFEFQVSLPLIAQSTFNGDASSYAFLTASMGVGAAFGGLFFASRKGITPYKLVSAALLFGAGGSGGSRDAEPAADRAGPGGGGGLLDQLLLPRQQHPAAVQLGPDARPGHVVLVDGFPGLDHRRRAPRRLVCRGSRGPLEPGPGRDRRPARRPAGRLDPAPPARRKIESKCSFLAASGQKTA